jgi:hypothetical protein
VTPAVGSNSRGSGHRNLPAADAGSEPMVGCEGAKAPNASLLINQPGRNLCDSVVKCQYAGHTASGRWVAVSESQFSPQHDRDYTFSSSPSPACFTLQRWLRSSARPGAIASSPLALLPCLALKQPYPGRLDHTRKKCLFSFLPLEAVMSYESTSHYTRCFLVITTLSGHAGPRFTGEETGGRL